MDRLNQPRHRVSEQRDTDQKFYQNAMDTNDNFATKSLSLGDHDSLQMIKDPGTRPISSDQLIAEVNSIYAELLIVEAKCCEIDAKQRQEVLAMDTMTPPLNHEQWQALIALHRTLLREDHDFFLTSQHPFAGAALLKLAQKYSMPAGMWRHRIHGFPELLRHRLPHSLGHISTLMHLADYKYSVMEHLYQTVPAFQETCIECLGDLCPYRMAIEDDGARNREAWQNCGKFWYSRAADKNPNFGRLYHHLAILARPNILHQSFFYCKSLGVVQPFQPADPWTECPENFIPFSGVIKGGDRVQIGSTDSENELKSNGQRGNCQQTSTAWMFTRLYNALNQHRDASPTNFLIRLAVFLIGVKWRLWDLAIFLKYRLAQPYQQFNVHQVGNQSNYRHSRSDVSHQFFGFYVRQMCEWLSIFHGLVPLLLLLPLPLVHCAPGPIWANATIEATDTVAKRTGGFTEPDKWNVSLQAVAAFIGIAALLIGLVKYWKNHTRNRSTDARSSDSTTSAHVPEQAPAVAAGAQNIHYHYNHHTFISNIPYQAPTNYQPYNHSAIMPNVD